MKRNDIAMLKRIFSYLKPFKLQITALVCMTLISSALSLATPLVMKYIVDDVIVKKQIDYLGFAVLVLIAAYLGGSALSFIASYLYSFVTQTVLLRLRQDMFGILERLPLSYFYRNKSGDIMSRFLNDVNALQGVTTGIILSAITDTSMLIATIAIMLYLDIRLALLTLVTASSLILIFFIFNNRLRIASRQGQEAISKVSSNLQETIAGIKVIKSFVRESYHHRVFSDKLRESFKIGMRLVVLGSLFRESIGFITFAGTTLVIVYGGYQVYLGRLSIGSLLAYFALISRVYSPIRNLAQLNSGIQTSVAALERVFAFMDLPTEQHDKEHVAHQPTDSPARISFSNVSFGYLSGQAILCDATFTINPNELVIIMGENGSGKSTIIDLMMRFYEPDRGHIALDDIDIKDIDIYELRRQFTVISQDIFLFNGTIEDNIRYGNLEACDDEIEEAAILAQARDFVLACPDGYKSHVGERGFCLSGGQRQRIALARAILHKGRILILDEPTAAIDVNTEKVIWGLIAELVNTYTVIVVAHRLPHHLPKPVRVLRMQDGKVIETEAEDREEKQIMDRTVV